MSATQTGNLVELRRLLAERFPGVRRGFAPRLPTEVWSTGIPSLDHLLGGGLPRGHLTELVGTGHGSGSAQVLHALLRRTVKDGKFMALVDGADSFDVDAEEVDVLSRLLWVRCAKAEEALKAADLLLRDRNFPLVVLDLKLNPATQLRKISSNVWHRFNRLVEHNGITLVVVTPQQIVGGAMCRARVESGLGVETLAHAPAEVIGQLRFELLRGTEKEEEGGKMARSG